LNRASAYADAGVDIAAADRAVELLRERLRVSEHDLLGGIGGFGAALTLPEGYRSPVLVTATDGVGTKTEIARRLGRFDTIGRDLVAMCADDIVCHGARPTFFLDYLAVGRVDPSRVADIVGGIAGACDEIDCALVGGETAEHPGMLEPDEFDLAGFCIGIVERDALIDGSAARAGDVVIGMASSGLHANGFSLVRTLLERGVLVLDQDLLTPTRLYAPAVLSLITALRERGLRLGGLAHVTGGGLPGNLPRALPEGLGIRVQTGGWPEPEIFGRITRAGDISDADMRATFNCGIGFAAAVAPDAVETAVDVLASEGVEAWPIGDIRPVAELGARYVEA
jgi:phosphoribosylformylglycinamidine cyclo-ligase